MKQILSDNEEELEEGDASGSEDYAELVRFVTEMSHHSTHGKPHIRRSIRRITLRWMP